jgi:hypothetical protein
VRIEPATSGTRRDRADMEWYQRIHALLVALQLESAASGCLQESESGREGITADNEPGASGYMWHSNGSVCSEVMPECGPGTERSGGCSCVCEKDDRRAPEAG